MLKRFPFALSLVLLWAAVRYSGVIDLSTSSIAFLVAVGLCIFTLAAEFYRSGDIMLNTFKVEQMLSVGQTFVLGCCTPLVFADPHLVDFMVGVTVILDAVIGPINSFRTALRNLSAAGFGHDMMGDHH